jgi:hypothetical protein
VLLGPGGVAVDRRHGRRARLWAAHLSPAELNRSAATLSISRAIATRDLPVSRWLGRRSLRPRTAFPTFSVAALSLEPDVSALGRHSIGNA